MAGKVSALWFCRWMCRGAVLWLTCLVFATLISTPTVAQKRVALVIGNGGYAKVPKLNNPGRDAAAIEAMLKAANFDVVQRVTDVGNTAMRRALRDFSDQVRDADIAVVFYAGHGIEMNGVNYLIPVDAVLERDTDVSDETITLDRVSEALEQAKRLRLIILDACRDNPFIPKMKRTVAGRSIGRGLAKVEVVSSDTLIAYAAKAGSVASDGSGNNSPYTAALVKHLPTPGLDVRLAMGRVRDEVMKATGNRQEPFVYGSLGGNEIPLLGDRSIPPPQRPPQTTDAPVPPTSAAAREWQDVKDTTSVAVLEGFIRRHPDHPVYLALAQERLDALQRQRTAALDKAEQEKRAAEEARRKQEEARKQADAKQKADAIAAKRVPQPGQTFRDCNDGCPEMVVVPAGSFMMGSPTGEAGRGNDEGPQRRVTIKQQFAVGKFEVTQGEFAAFVTATGHKTDGGCFVWTGSEWKMQADKSWRDPGFAQTDRHPVACVNWNDAKAYIAWLSRKTGASYRLLTEAEWEYAARAGSQTRFSFGDSDSVLGQHAWYSSNSNSRSQSVGGKTANNFGLHDMHGNLWEWVDDCYENNYNGAPADGSARVSSSCGSRVLRGGSWS